MNKQDFVAPFNVGTQEGEFIVGSNIVGSINGKVFNWAYIVRDKDGKIREAFEYLNSAKEFAKKLNVESGFTATGNKKYTKEQKAACIKQTASKEERNKKILEDVLNGKSYKDVGYEHGIHPERARQIVYGTIRKISKSLFEECTSPTVSVEWLRKNKDRILGFKQDVK